MDRKTLSNELNAVFTVEDYQRKTKVTMHDLPSRKSQPNFPRKVRLSLEEEALKGRREENFLSENVCVKCRHQNGTVSNGSVGSERCCENINCDGSVCSGSGNHVRKRGCRRISENWSEEKDLDTPDSEDSNDSKTVLIREEIEKLVEEMVGDSLDGVSVGKLSKNSSYLAMFAKHHEALCQELAKLGYALHISLLNKNGLDVDSPRLAHSTLKSLVEKVIAEAMKLPKMREVLQSQTSTEEIGNENNFSNKSYEDILATAILNKVIEQCQRRQEQGSRKKHKRSAKNARNRNNNIIYNEEDGDDPDTLYNSDWSGTSRSEQLSLTIEEHIEEITTTYENSEEDEFDEDINFNGAIPFPESGRVILNGDREDSDGDGDAHSSATELITTGNSWEENWLFQRKRLRSGGKSHHPVPVPMLVPNPSQDFRALIGGVDADDLSEMSECSDSLLEEIVLAADERVEEEEEGGKEESLGEGGNEIVRVPEGEENLTSLNSESSCPSLYQKERDVSVDYECFRKFDIELRDPTLQRSTDAGKVEMEECSQRPKCRIAEREKEKWNHPVHLADNPYSAENILKREQKKRMDYFRTGYRREESIEFPCDATPGIVEETTVEEIHDRDYYVRASRCPTGDPTVRSTPETEESEPFEEVRNQMSESTESFRRADEKTGEVMEENRRRRKVIDYWEEGVLRNRIAETTNVILPNVKELTKKFARGIEEFSPRPSPTPSANSPELEELKRERSSSARNLSKDSDSNDSKRIQLANEEVTPSRSATSRSNVSPGGEIDLVEPSVGKVKAVGDGSESDDKNRKSTEAIKFSSLMNFAKSIGKEVHSLTARSISKEFREELKNNSSRRSIPKVDRSGCGERERPIEVVSESERNRPPTPPIDLQSKRQFWEDIISKAQK